MRTCLLVQRSWSCILSALSQNELWIHYTASHTQISTNKQTKQNQPIKQTKSTKNTHTLISACVMVKSLMEALGCIPFCFREKWCNQTTSCGHLFPIKARDPREEQGHTGMPGLWFLPRQPQFSLEGEWCWEDRRGGDRWDFHIIWEDLFTDQSTENLIPRMVQPFESFWVCCQFF